MSKDSDTGQEGKCEIGGMGPWRERGPAMPSNAHDTHDIEAKPPLHGNFPRMVERNL
jgi:hypothetical protein